GSGYRRDQLRRRYGHLLDHPLIAVSVNKWYEKSPSREGLFFAGTNPRLPFAPEHEPPVAFPRVMVTSPHSTTQRNGSWPKSCVQQLGRSVAGDDNHGQQAAGLHLDRTDDRGGNHRHFGRDR